MDRSQKGDAAREQKEIMGAAYDAPARLWFADATGKFQGAAPESPGLADALVPLIRRVAANGGSEAVDIHSTTDDGTERMHRVVARVLPHAIDGATVALGVVDLSMVKRMLGRFGMIMRATRNVAWEIEFRTGRIWWNDQAYELYGYDPSTTLTFDHFARMIHPEDRERILAHNDEILHGDVVDWDNEYRMVRPDGSIYVTRDRGYIDRDADGKPRRMVGVQNDITEQRTAEQQLRQSEQRFRSLVNQMTDAMFVLDPEGRITDVNPFCCESLGYSREELQEMTIADLDPSTKGEDFMYRIRDAFQPNQPIMLETALRRKDGSELPAEIRFSPVEMENKPAILGLARNISERKLAEEERLRLEAQMQHAQKLESLGVLAGGIAHDFNNLLVGILGHIDLALIDLPAASPVRAHLAEIETTAVRAADLVRQMLAYSGKGKFVVKRLDLGELVEQISHLLDATISKKATLKYELESDLPAVEVDPTQLSQVLMNLIINASEALGDKSGQITICTGAVRCDRAYLQTTYIDEDLEEGTYVFVEVSDDGQGMSKEVQKKIFDPFFTTKFTGRGLGLAAVLGIVRGHQGTVKVYSEPDRGTTFKVLFPAVDQPVDRDDAAATEDSKWRGSGTVLLVDDEKTVLTVGKKMLERMGFDVLIAVNGQQALELFAEHAADVVCVVLDLTMPHPDGEETFHEMRRIAPDVRVVLSSGYNEQAVVQKFAGKGLAGFIQKPYKLNALRQVIRAALKG